jgi:hypothetical protein
MHRLMPQSAEASRAIRVMLCSGKTLPPLRRLVALHLDIHFAKDYFSLGFCKFERRRRSGVSLPRTLPSNKTSAKDPPSVGDGHA